MANNNSAYGDPSQHWFCAYSGPLTVLCALYLTSFNLQKMSRNGYDYCAHLTDEKTEVQRSYR